MIDVMHAALREAFRFLATERIVSVVLVFHISVPFVQSGQCGAVGVYV